MRKRHGVPGITGGSGLSLRERGREYPILEPIVHGWAARGPGWAVHGRTKAEAVQHYADAEARHREIDQRPFWCERREPEGLTERAEG